MRSSKSVKDTHHSREQHDWITYVILEVKLHDDQQPQRQTYISVTNAGKRKPAPSVIALVAGPSKRRPEVEHRWRVSVSCHVVILMVVAFSSLARILGECSTTHLPPALFFEVEISSHTLISLFRPGSVHSGSASWDDRGRMFPDK